MIKLDRLAYFSAVVETGSFTRAAERMGVTKAVVSAHVARLEDALGTALFTRSTRHVRPTDAGLMLHDRCRRILHEVEEAENEISHSLSEPRGILRLTAPNDYGQSVLLPLLADFRRRYPACQVDLQLDDQLTDMQSGNFDMAIRLGWPADSALKSRHIGAFKQFLVACPQLAGASPTLNHPAELENLPFIANAALRDPVSWRFARGGEEVQVKLAPVASVNTTPAVLGAALAGMGFAILPDFLVRTPIREGRLQAVLPDWTLRTGGIFIIFPPARFRLPKVTAFTALLVQSASRTADQG